LVRSSALSELFDLKRELRAKQFDLVIDLQGLFRSGWLTWQTKPHPLGFANAREFSWARLHAQSPVENVEQHAIDRYLLITDLLDALAISSNLFSRQTTPIAGRRRAFRQASIATPFLSRHNWETKRWPIEYFAALVEPSKNSSA